MKKRKYALLLINPKRKYRYHWDFKELCEMMGKKTPVLPLALPTIAALSPDHYDIAIVDEEIASLDVDNLERVPDIVGITALGPSVSRGYELADHFRDRGIPVVMGGPQVSFNVEESLEHADTVIIGEAEDIWQECLADFEKGCLKASYKRNTPLAFKYSPVPRWDLVDCSQVMALPVQVSRGCPYSCDFCLVRNMFGAKQRYRDIDNVMEEIKALPGKQLTFADDNLTGNKKYARVLMKRLRPLGVSWMCQSSLELCRDDELIAAMAEAGCTAILLGIESLDGACLKEAGKHQNKVELYEEGIARIHGHGIHVISSFIVGFDHDRLDAFDKIYDFTIKNNLSYIMLNVLTAYPGTHLYERMKEQGRIADIDPNLLNGIYPTMQYAHISQTEMFEKYFETLEKMFSYELVGQKAKNSLGSGSFTHYNEADISIREKFSSIAGLIKRYLFSGDRSRKVLLFDLFGAALNRRVTLGNVVEFLLMIASFNGYLEFTKEHRREIIKEISNNDPGPLFTD